MNGNPPNPTGRPEGGRSELFAEQIRKIADARGRRRRGRAIDELAVAVQKSNAVLPFVTRLMGGDRHANRLALEIVQRLPVPIPEAICQLVLPLLADARYSVPLRLNGATQVLRSLPPTSPLVGDLLQGLIREWKPRRARERLRFIQQQLPDHPVLKRFCDEMENRAAIPCPRCGLRLQRTELILHLWHVHRLLMEGSRAREPWKMIEDWLLEYARTGRKDLLERGLELGQQLDRDNGLTRVHRLLLAAGLTDEEAEQNLTTQAEGSRSSLCPHCYALVPQKPEALPPPMSLSRGRITSHGFTVDVSDRFVFTRLLVATPKEILHEGPEPERELTQRGSVLMQIGPMVLFSLMVAILLPTRLLPPLTPVSLILLVALLLYLRMRLGEGPADDPTQRAVDHAWGFIAPEMHRPDFSREDAEFLASLAVTSIGRGSPEFREMALERCCKMAREELKENAVPPRDLAALRCLELDDCLRLGRDPVPILADEIAACLSAELPLPYAEQLLEVWPSEVRDRGQRARLRILLVARAFEIGLEASDLNELGKVSAALGQAYASEDLDGLSRLRWLWNGKQSRPWRKNGSATTVFDLARYPALGGQFLEARPDLLLFQPMSAGNDAESGAPILICEEGIVYRDIVVSDPKTPITVRAKSLLNGGGYELSIGKERLHFKQEPALLARRLRGWVRYLFRDLLPGAIEWTEKSAPAKLRPLMLQKTIACPECGETFYPLRGEVGILTGDRLGVESR